MWLYVIKTLVVLSAITNTAIIIFTTDAFELETEKGKWLTFLIIEHVLLFTKFVISAVIPDEPQEVKDGIEWSERIVNEKLYGRLGDGDKARRERNLELKSPRDRKVFGNNPKEIPPSDI